MKNSGWIDVLLPLNQFYTNVGNPATQPRANRYSSLREKRAAAKAQGTYRAQPQ